MNVNLKFTSIGYIPRSGIAELYCILFLTFEDLRLFPKKLFYSTFSLAVYTSLPQYMHISPHRDMIINQKQLTYIFAIIMIVFYSYYTSWYEVIIQHPEEFS